MIEKAKDKGFIKEITFAGKPALQKGKGNQSSVIFRDKTSSLYSQTTGTDIHSELIDFKKFMFSELANLRASTHDNKDKGMHPSENKTVLIKCLQNRITSLEKQLDEKQMIIEESTKIIGKLIPNETEQYGHRRVAVQHNKNSSNLHENQDLQSKDQTQESHEKPVPIIVDITSEQKTQANTKSKKGKKKKNEHKEHSTPQINQVPEEPQPALGNENENNNKSSEHNEGKNKRLHVTIVGDSLLNGIDEKGLSRHHIVKVKNHPGANMEDIADNIKPAVRMKPDILIIHAGTNDFNKNINTIEVLKKTIKSVKEESPETKIAVSTLLTRRDKPGMDKKVQDINRKISKLNKRQCRLIEIISSSFPPDQDSCALPAHPITLEMDRGMML